MMLAGADFADLLGEIAGHLLASRADVASRAIDHIFFSAACRAAVKAGDLTGETEREAFAEKVLNSPEIQHCPHGRPVLFAMPKREIERRFGRIQ
jgi:DNA mismatch repair protein MutL